YGGVVGAGAELFEQIGEARVAVRLDDRDDLALGCRAGGTQHGGDLHGVVAVVVDHGDAIGLAGAGEAALHTGEGGERTAHHVVVDAHLVGDGDGGQRVLHVVPAQHRQLEAGEGAASVVLAIGDDDVIGRGVGADVDVHGAHVGLRAHAVGDDAAVGEARNHRLHDRVIDAEHGEAVERDVLDEILVGPVHRLDRAVVIEVLGVHVG